MSAARGMTSGEIAKARRMREAGLSYKAIGDRLGWALHTIRRRLLPPEDRQAEMAKSQSSREVKAASERRHRAKCVDCSRPLGVSSEWRGTKRCILCHHAHQHQTAHHRRKQIEALWLDGLATAVIADKLDFTEGSISVEITRMRKSGAYNVPRRGPGGRILSGPQ